jgi:hypothetical protein
MGSEKKVFPTPDDWPKALFIMKKQYHEQCFEENEFSWLLKNLEMLYNMLPDDLYPFHACLGHCMMQWKPALVSHLIPLTMKRWHTLPLATLR